MKLNGLSEAEVREKTERGEVNDVPDDKSRKYSEIFAENIFTPFNALLTVLMLSVFAVGGGVVNVLFFGILIANMAIGIFQEIRAKLTLDKVAILSAPKAKVLRDGKIREIPIREIVLGENIILGLGDQIVADGSVLRSEDLEIDESLLTGESDPILKKAGEKVLSGSIVVAGSGVMAAEKIGADSYSAKLVKEAKKFSGESSEVQRSINRLLKWISWSLIIIVPILLIGQLRIRGDWHMSALRSIAAIVGMIPNGLVMLASVAFMLAAVKLAKKSVLVQRMPAVETLARVDTLLLDKTGTLTEGNIRLEATILENQEQKDQIQTALATIASRNTAPTNLAIAEQLRGIAPADFTREIAFSSARKFSAIEIGKFNYVFGAPEILLADKKFVKNLKEIQKIAANGKRVLVLCENSDVFSEKSGDFEQVFKKNTPVATVILSEKVRENAAETLGYFRDQGVDIKVISGDSPATVAAIARSVQMENVREFDARNLPKTQNKKFAEIVETHNVFGRVKPEQKRQIAEFLQSQKHVVAMTGDGVNDALALKKADLGIAMESGSSATKSVAEIVLLDNDFAHLPEVLAEGRRVIANVERVANLFIVKNVFIAALAIMTTVIGLRYPYLPIQMSLIDFFAIGFPAFFLALAPNKQLYKPGFLARVLKFVIPVGVVVAVIMLVDYYLIYRKGMSIEVVGTSVSIVTMVAFLSVLTMLARPFNLWKVLLVLFSATGFFVVIATPLRQIFKYEFDLRMIFATVFMSLITIAAIILISQINKKINAGKRGGIIK